MDTCILKQCRAGVRSQILTPTWIAGTARPSHSCLELTLEWPGKDDRRCLILDVDPLHPTAHTARRGRGTQRPGAGFADRICGSRLAAIGPDTGGRKDEPRIWSLDLCDARGELQWRLFAAWTGRTGNIRLTDPSGLVLEALLPGGPRPGDPYSPPPEDTRVPAGEALPHLAGALQGTEPGRRHHALRRTVRGVELPAALDALLTALELCPDLAGAITDRHTAERAAEEILRALRLPHGGPANRRSHGSPLPDGAAVGTGIPSAHGDTGCTEHHLYIFPAGGMNLPPHLDTTSLPTAWLSSVRFPSLERFRSAEELPLRDLLERAHQLQCRDAEREKKRGEALRILRYEGGRLRRLHTALMKERVSPAEGLRLRRSGEAILASMKTIRRGQSELFLPDWNDQEGKAGFRISLDPARSPADNAAGCFKAARRWDRGEPHRTRRLAAIDRASARLAKLEARIAEGSQPLSGAGFVREVEQALGFLISPRARDMLRALEEPHASPARAGGGRAVRSGRTGGKARSDAGRTVQPGRSGGKARAAADADSRFRPRSFRTREGWTVLVGRSNEENDHLTHRMAHPEDYWLHAQGVPGSHVVLRREGRRDNPSAKTLEEAAAIAAFFSKARHSRKVPVLYTLKKYVRKPRKARPGLAVCTREKTLMVAPKDPTEGMAPEWMEEE